ncbi:hypothetical protein X777_11116 [Ooceraea biroi]|uniref:Uncharacterized protein n=1 Tax=Ooceraea biroi TaxID=2015173 RepID=A0A026W3Q9_OOCBI|nr:hypothetical protein X777_11116 [Ooceraea biroi]
MSVPPFVDLQGFIIGGNFVVKEVAVLRNGNILSHYIFGPCVPWYSLNKDAETPPKKCISVLPARRAVRILNSRYALTATGYKYLVIGINVGPPSYVEIEIGDHRGNELILSLETWKELYEQRWDIQNRLRKDVRGRPITVGPLTVRFSESLVCDTKLTKDVTNVISANDCFSANNIIDCELLALVFSKPL